MYSLKKFLSRAREHQYRFLQSEFGVASAHEKSVWLSRSLAARGGNFFSLPQVISAVRERYPRAAAGVGLPYMPLTYDMLRSQHIPFNFFAPLLRGIGQRSGAALFAAMLGLPVTELESVKIEYAPADARRMLGDNTCFDAFAIVKCDGRRIAIGIEVKYTEGPYRWTPTERRRMHDPSSHYASLTASCDFYRAGAMDALRTRTQKQMWRNQLLAHCVTQACGQIDACRYVLLCPAASGYCHEMAEGYASLLTDAAIDAGAFQRVTYEQFIAVARDIKLQTDALDWPGYLERRYLFA